MTAPGEVGHRPENASAVALEGRQIRLRDWQRDDLSVYEHWMMPGQRWQDFDAPYLAHPAPDEVRAMVAALHARVEAADWPTPRQRLVIADRETDWLLGTVSWSWESEETLWPAAGIALFDPATWGGGVGREALGLWTQYLFDSLPRIVRLDLRTWSGNVRMMHLAERVGYRLEARFRRARIVGGEYYDSLGYGILREEWYERYPEGFAAVLADA
jgi:putative hydrolase of HD superfamily